MIDGRRCCNVTLTAAVHVILAAFRDLGKQTTEHRYIYHRTYKFLWHVFKYTTSIFARNSMTAGEQYRLIHAMIVKLYHPYTQFPRNVST